MRTAAPHTFRSGSEPQAVTGGQFPPETFMPEDIIADAQDALNEAALILEACAYVTAAEHADPGRWRAVVGILHDVLARRLRIASAAVDTLEGDEQ